MNTEAEIVGIKKDIEYLKTCCNKMDTLRNGDSTQNQTLSEIKNQIESLEAGMDRHLAWHDKKDAKKWQLVLLVLAPFVSIIIGIALSKYI